MAAEVVNLAERRKAREEPASDADSTTPEPTPVETSDSTNGSAPSRGFNIDTSGPTISGIVGTAAGLGLAGYIGAVTLQGNLPALWQQLQQEELYIEFAIAIVIVWALMKYGPTSPIVDLLVLAAVVAVALKVAGNTSLQPALSQFASGQATMSQTIQAIFSGTGTQITI